MGLPLLDSKFDSRIAELQYAIEVFGEEEAAMHWLDTGLWELDNLSPRETIAPNGESGLQRARDVLLGIE